MLASNRLITNIVDMLSPHIIRNKHFSKFGGNSAVDNTVDNNGLNPCKFGGIPAHAGITFEAVREPGILACSQSEPGCCSMPTRASLPRWAAFPGAVSTTI